MASTPASILTVPTPQRHRNWLATGNHWVSLPLIDPGSGGLHRVGVVSMGCRGVLALSSGADWNAAGADPGRPLLDFTVTSGDGDPAAGGPAGAPRPPGACTCRLAEEWVPSFAAEVAGLRFSWRIFAPPGEKGFLLDAALANPGETVRRATVALTGRWALTELSMFQPRRVPCVNTLLHDPWTDALVLEATRTGDLLALGLGCATAVDRILGGCTADSGGSGLAELRPGGCLEAPNDGLHPIEFRLEKDLVLDPGEEARLTFFAAVNLERDGARTGTVHLRRRGAEALWEETRADLGKVGLGLGLGLGEDALAGLLRRHLLFNHFYAVGRALDTGEAVPVTSLSPRYYVSGATWERDTLLWCFPALLLSCQELAREVLLAMFRRHFRNAGEHAHYLDGNVIYPGFELDELSLYPVALGGYLDATGDRSLLAEPEVARALAEWPSRLEVRRHPTLPLYSTMLLSSDDPSPHPWVTYGNVLAWRALTVLAGLAGAAGETGRAADLERQASELRAAIFAHLVDPATGRLAWSTDLAGSFRTYDEPSGSLLLLPFLGFCAPDDERWLRTARWICSKENVFWHGGRLYPGLACLHYPDHPGGLGLAACLLSGLPDAVEAALGVLRRAPLDGGLVPESFDPETGEARTGCAFATAAGYLAWALHRLLVPAAQGAFRGLDVGRSHDLRPGR